MPPGSIRLSKYRPLKMLLKAYIMEVFGRICPLPTLASFIPSPVYPPSDRNKFVGVPTSCDYASPPLSSDGNK